MYIERRYSLLNVLRWSRAEWGLSLLWSLVACGLVIGSVELSRTHGYPPYLLMMPWTPISLIGIAVAFYVGFKNNASYERQWEARKIWGGIVNDCRAWAVAVRDLVTTDHAEGRPVAPGRQDDFQQELLNRQVAWLDALRFGLRSLRQWEHRGTRFEAKGFRGLAPEANETLDEVLLEHVSAEELGAAKATDNPALYLLGRQSMVLARMRHEGLLDGFAHMEMQKLIQQMMSLQGQAERIKNFPFPRQYSTVNVVFVRLFVLLLPFALASDLGGSWQHTLLAVPMSTIVAWVFLTSSKVGEWSENPFEGLVNDVPITTMARGIERDMLQQAGGKTPRPGREPIQSALY